MYKASNDNYDKIDLVWRQLIGFEMRRLPGIDRCVMAQGLYFVIEHAEALARSYNLRYGGAGANFPITLSDDSLVGLGGDFAIDAFATWVRGVECIDGGVVVAGSGHVVARIVGKLMSNKNFKLTELMQSHSAQQPSTCVMC